MGADEKEEIINSLRACISSRKGGVPFHELNGEYKELVGEYIPFMKFGYENLLSFLRSVPGVSVDEKESMIRTVPTATTKHLHDLINKQKDNVKKCKPRYLPYKKTQPPLKSATKAPQNQPKPKPVQKAPLPPPKQPAIAKNSMPANQSYLGQYPYQQQNLNAIYENEFWHQFEDLVMHYNNNNYDSYWGQYQPPTYMHNQNGYNSYDYYDPYYSKYPSQYKNRKQRKYRPYNNKSKGVNNSKVINYNTCDDQRNKSTKERFVNIMNVQYKPFSDDSQWLNNDSKWSAETLDIGDYQVIGDALMLQLLGCKPSELCDYNMTINEATHRVTKIGCSNKVLIALGTIDVLNGAGYEELSWSMESLINTVVSAGGEPVVCTVPPVPGIRGNFHAISSLVAFNRWLWRSLKPRHVVNLTAVFYSDGQINFNLFDKPLTNFPSCIRPMQLWNQDGMALVSKRLNQKLQTTGT